MPRPPWESLIGKKYNRLTVIQETGYKTQWKSKKYFYLCRCDCWAEKDINRYHLLSWNTKSCGCKKYKQPMGDKSPTWKWGRRIDEGYQSVYMPFHHRAKSNWYTKEHTLVMEEKIGRFLVKWENVHHINGIKTDNRPENLELWSTSQPSGQRVEDKVKWAREIISLYDNICQKSGS